MTDHADRVEGQEYAIYVAVISLMYYKNGSHVNRKFFLSTFQGAAKAKFLWKKYKFEVEVEP